jgi:hypothetical protein
VVRLDSPDTELVQALYVPGADDRLLVIAGADDGRLRLHLYDRSVRPWRSMAAIDDVAVARIDSANRRVLFTRPGQPGLWQADMTLSPASVAQLDPALPDVARYRVWAVAENGSIYFLERTSDCASALRRRGDAAPLLCVDRSRRTGPGGFSLNPRGDAMYVTISLWDGGDIGFMPLTIEPEESGPH